LLGVYYDGYLFGLKKIGKISYAENLLEIGEGMDIDEVLKIYPELNNKQYWIDNNYFGFNHSSLQSLSKQIK
jgi:hypothetical protein